MTKYLTVTVATAASIALIWRATAPEPVEEAV